MSDKNTNIKHSLLNTQYNEIRERNVLNFPILWRRVPGRAHCVGRRFPSTSSGPPFPAQWQCLPSSFEARPPPEAQSRTAPVPFETVGRIGKGRGEGRRGGRGGERGGEERGEGEGWGERSSDKYSQRKQQLSIHYTTYTLQCNLHTYTTTHKMA